MQERLPGLGHQRVYHIQPPSSLNSGGDSGSRGYSPVKSFCSLGLAVPISAAGGPISSGYSGYGRDLISILWTNGRITLLACSVPAVQSGTSRPSLQAPASGAGAI